MTTPTNPQHMPEPQYPPQQFAPTPTPPAKRGKAPWVIAATVGLLFGGAAIILAIKVGSSALPGSKPASPLLAARDACGVGAPDVQLEDGDKTLVIDGVGEEDSGASDGTMMCILEYLQTPGAVIAKMDATNALAGRQEATWDKFTASWTYHPDNGLDLIIEVKP